MRRRDRWKKWLAAGMVVLVVCVWETSGARTPWRLTLRGEAEQFRTFQQDGPLGRSAATGGLRLSYDDRFRFYGVGDVRARADHVLPERDRVWVAEGFAAVAAGPLEIAAGRQQIRWGRLDSLRPTDIFRRRDVTDPLEDRDEPIWAARCDLFVGPLTLEAVYVPLFEPDILSFDERNPWCLFPDSVAVEEVGALPTDVTRGRRLGPADEVGSDEYGLRLDLHAGGWDLGACVGRAYERLPTVVVAAEPELTPEGRARVRVDLAYAPQRILGADLARPLGPGTVRLEGARVWPEEIAGYGAEPAYTRAGVGVDRSLARWGYGGEVRLLVQYAYDGGWTGETGIARYRHLFRHAGLVRMRIDPGAFTRLEVETLFDLERNDRFATIELSWTSPYGLGLTAGLLLVDGDEEGALGRFRDEDRLRLRAVYAWSIP